MFISLEVIHFSSCFAFSLCWSLDGLELELTLFLHNSLTKSTFMRVCACVRACVWQHEKHRKSSIFKMNSFNSVALFLAVFLTVALNTESKFCGSTDSEEAMCLDVFDLFYIRDVVMAFLLQYLP